MIHTIVYGKSLPMTLQSRSLGESIINKHKLWDNYDLGSVALVFLEESNQEQPQVTNVSENLQVILKLLLQFNQFSTEKKEVYNSFILYKQYLGRTVENYMASLYQSNDPAYERLVKLKEEIETLKYEQGVAAQGTGRQRRQKNYKLKKYQDEISKRLIEELRLSEQHTDVLKLEERSKTFDIQHSGKSKVFYTQFQKSQMERNKLVEKNIKQSKTENKWSFETHAEKNLIFEAKMNLVKRTPKLGNIQRENLFRFSEMKHVTQESLKIVTARIEKQIEKQIEKRTTSQVQEAVISQLTEQTTMKITGQSTASLTFRIADRTTERLTEYLTNKFTKKIMKNISYRPVERTRLQKTDNLFQSHQITKETISRWMENVNLREYKELRKDISRLERSRLVTLMAKATKEEKTDLVKLFSERGILTRESLTLKKENPDAAIRTIIEKSNEETYDSVKKMLVSTVRSLEKEYTTFEKKSRQLEEKKLSTFLEKTESKAHQGQLSKNQETFQKQTNRVLVKRLLEVEQGQESKIFKTIFEEIEKGSSDKLIFVNLMKIIEEHYSSMTKGNTIIAKGMLKSGEILKPIQGGVRGNKNNKTQNKTTIDNRKFPKLINWENKKKNNTVSTEEHSLYRIENSARTLILQQKYQLNRNKEFSKEIQRESQKILHLKTPMESDYLAKGGILAKTFMLQREYQLNQNKEFQRENQRENQREIQIENRMEIQRSDQIFSSQVYREDAVKKSLFSTRIIEEIYRREREEKKKDKYEIVNLNNTLNNNLNNTLANTLSNKMFKRIVNVELRKTKRGLNSNNVFENKLFHVVSFHERFIKTQQLKYNFEENQVLAIEKATSRVSADEQTVAKIIQRERNQEVRELKFAKKEKVQGNDELERQKQLVTELSKQVREQGETLQTLSQNKATQGKQESGNFKVKEIEEQEKASKEFVKKVKKEVMETLEKEMRLERQRRGL